MTSKTAAHSLFCCLLGLCFTTAARSEIEVPYQLSKIDEGVAWVSSYWGYNTPKLVYDGDSYYTVALWGAEQATGTGVLYKFQDGEWRRGYSWDDLNYQPGMLLLDNQRHLILIYPRINDSPVILRSIAPGDIDHFEAIPVPAAINKAGYMGVGIHDDRIVLGYIGDPDTFSFTVAWFDLATQTWSGPHVIAPAQRQQEPWTTWLYPIVQPDAAGIHLAVSNNADLSSYYDRILYMYIPYDRPDDVQVEQVARVDPWTSNVSFGEAMWRDPDGAVYITGQFKPQDATSQLHLYQRDPQTQIWSDQSISSVQIAAVFHHPGTARLWMPSTYGSALRLYTSGDDGQTWEQAILADFAAYDLVSTFFLHGITPSSGSSMPEVPTIVFSAGPHPNYQLWFAQFDTRPVSTAVLTDQAVLPTHLSLKQNYPNPFNGNTAIRFTLATATDIDLSIHNLNGQHVVNLATGSRRPGEHVVRWDGRDSDGHLLSTGIYFYRLSSGSKTTTRKLLLLQ
jgi:hypothetical protein